MNRINNNSTVSDRNYKHLEELKKSINDYQKNRNESRNESSRKHDCWQEWFYK